MSEQELKRAAVLSRISKAGWSLVQAAERMQVSYWQAKRLWKRYRAHGAKGLVHGNAGRESNRAKPKSLRRRVLALLRKKYGGEVGERFGPTLAAEHLAEEDGIELGVETLRGWMLEGGCGAGTGGGLSIGRGGNGKRTLGSWCSWTGAFTTGWKGRVRRTSSRRARVAHCHPAAVVGGRGLRCALNTSPFGLRRATLRPQPPTGCNHGPSYDQNQRQKE